MSETNLEQAADPAQFGTWLAEKTRAEQQAKLDALSAENMSQHRPVHDHLTRSQRGMFGMSGQEQAAALADQPPVVGSDFGGRPLARNGGAWDMASITDSPCPPRADLTRVNQPGHLPPGDQMSPALRHQLGLGEWQ